MVRVRQGDNAGAETALRAAVALQPGSGAAARNLAHLFLATGRPDDAAKTYGDILAKKPNDVAGLLGLAEVAVAQQKWDEAANYTSRAQTAAPEDPVPGIHRVNLNLLRNDAAQAKSVADQLAAQFPSNPDVLDAQGRAQVAAGDSKGAVSTYKRAYELAPKSEVVFARYLSLLLGAKNFTEARTVLQQGVDRNPTNAGLKIDLIRVEAQAGGVDAGIAKARSFAKDDPDNAVYDLVSAELYEKAGRKDDARALLEKAAVARPSNTGLVIGLAALYGRTGDPAKAEALLKSKLKDAPDNAALHLALASYHQNAKNFPGAIDEYGRVVALRPNDPAVLNNLAWLYQQQGDLAKARDFAERAVVLAPRAGQIEDTLGWILLAQGDTAKALTHLTAASAAVPREPSIQYHLAAALDRSGKPADARALLEKLLSSGAAFAEKADAEKLLQQLKNG
jgi:putative PEP-CTERM system TPR-repeat lipoprotein